MAKTRGDSSRTDTPDAARSWLVEGRIDKNTPRVSWPAKLSGKDRDEFFRVARQGRGLSGVTVRPLSDSKRPDLIGEYVTIIPVQEKDSALHFDMWLVFGKLARNEVGHLILATLTATPYSDEFGAEGLTYRVWQHIRPPRLLEAARLALHREAALLGLKSKVAPLKEEERERIEANDDLLGDDRSFLRGRPRRSDDEVADFAEKWLEVQNDPDRKRAVLDELSERLDKPRETVKTWKRQAVVRHFLTSGAAGRKAACEAGERLSERKGK